MKVFGHPASTCTRKVLCTLAEKGADYQFEMVDIMKGEHKAPAHLARQPFGVVPALEDDGFILFESRAIIRYLDVKLPGAALSPSDAKGRGEMEQWISVEQSYFTPKAMAVIYETLFNPMFGKPTDEEKLGKGREAVTQVNEILDRHLAGRDFFAGAFSLADICYAPYVEYLFAGKQGDLITGHKNLGAWWGRVSERASWRKATGKLDQSGEATGRGFEGRVRFASAPTLSSRAGAQAPLLGTTMLWRRRYMRMWARSTSARRAISEMLPLVSW